MDTYITYSLLTQENDYQKRRNEEYNKAKNGNKTGTRISENETRQHDSQELTSLMDDLQEEI